MNAPNAAFLRDDAATRRLGTDPIPARPYYDAGYFELERQAVFRRTWLQVAHVSELAVPGDFVVRRIEVNAASILIVRGKDGDIRAFHNVCVHRGTKLVDEEAGRRKAFTCRYHGWTFASDGTLKGAPDFDQFDLDKRDCALKAIVADTCAGPVFVNFDPAPAEGLREFLGPLAERLGALPVARATTFAEYVYDIDANWKLKLRDEPGCRNIMWSSDYPYSETTFPHSHETIEHDLRGVPEPDRRWIVAACAEKFL